ncbi:MAG: hypothetical protein FJ042_06530 [Candidatus Cloacimonetes bacterium]|nr:hypothetical protein [Candidatus Cloacimonadota bacterium]
MQFTLPDGQIIDLNKVAELSSIRDLGPDPHKISQCLIGFSIRMKNGQSIQVTKNYHFSDWAQAKKELELILKEIQDKIKSK